MRTVPRRLALNEATSLGYRVVLNCNKDTTEVEYGNFTNYFFKSEQRTIGNVTNLILGVQSHEGCRKFHLLPIKVPYYCLKLRLAWLLPTGGGGGVK